MLDGLCLAGNAEAQEALQEFTSFLEAEAEQGHISRSLKKKVLGTCVYYDCSYALLTSAVDGNKRALDTLTPVPIGQEAR
jgi:hypothetical protein